MSTAFQPVSPRPKWRKPSVYRCAVGLLDLVEILPRPGHAVEAFCAVLGECNRTFPDPVKQAGPLGRIVTFLFGMGTADVEVAIANGASPRDVDAALRWYLGRLGDLRVQLASAGISVPK